MVKLKNKKSKLRVFTLRKDAESKINELKKSKVSFFVSRTLSSCKITIPSRNEAYFKGGKGYTMKEINSQLDLKRKIHKNIIEKQISVPSYTASEIKYSQYSDYILNQLELNKKLYDFVEFDITKAYYKVAYNLGYIDEMMYRKYIDLPKHIRLRFLGSIATKKRKYSYDKGVMLGDPELIEDKLLRKVWFHICKVTDDCLSEFMKLTGDSFLMYYVDGIYLRKGNYSKIVKYISDKYKVEFKEERVESIVREWDKDAKSFKVVIAKWSDKKNTFVDKDFVLRNKCIIGGGYKKVLADNNIKNN